MKLILVILFWKAVIAALVYRYRNTRVMQVYWAGFSSALNEAILLKEPPDFAIKYSEQDMFNGGRITLIGLIVVAILAVLGTATFSIYAVC